VWVLAQGVALGLEELLLQGWSLAPEWRKQVLSWERVQAQGEVMALEGLLLQVWSPVQECSPKSLHTKILSVLATIRSTGSDQPRIHPPMSRRNLLHPPLPPAMRSTWLHSRASSKRFCYPHRSWR
jgi:hypothetical protein